MSERQIGDESPSGYVWDGSEYIKRSAYESKREAAPLEYPQVKAWSLSQEDRIIEPMISEVASVSLRVGDQKVVLEDRDWALRPTPNIAPVIKQLLARIEPHPERGGLVETPDRAAKAWLEWTSGYGKDPASILKVFEDGADGCDEMVVVHDIPVYSHCEHHLAPIFGTAVVAYIPNGRIVGLSKLPRLVDIFARRLQVQERMTNQVAEAIMEHLQPRGCGVVVKARHMCMESRGIKQIGGYTTTSALRGVFKDDHKVRAEFLSLAHNGGAK